MKICENRNDLLQILDSPGMFHNYTALICGGCGGLNNREPKRLKMSWDVVGSIIIIIMNSPYPCKF